MSLQPPRVVLVIEDEANIASVIRQSLAGLLVEVIVAETGEKGVEMAAQVAPHLILLDLALPEMSGWEALRQIRSTPHGADVPVAIVTAHGDSETAVEAQSAGADEFLTKPFQPSELRRVVELLLRPTDSAVT